MSHGRQVTLCIRSNVFVLKGTWEWDLSSEDIYCSDVMAFPEGFEGTKGVFHPDDVEQVARSLKLLQHSEISRLSFRMLSTYGEVKRLDGEQLSIEQVPGDSIGEKELEEQSWGKAFRELAQRKENSLLQLRQELADFTEGMHDLGTWYMNKSTNQAWYSDQVYRIYGLMAQSLNAHVNTFNAYIHPEDRVMVIDAFENAYEQELPLHITYRIVTTGGALRYVQQVTQWTFTAKGEHILYGILRDMSEAQAIGEQLSAGEAIFQLQQQVLKFSEQQANTGYWFVDLVTRKTVYSDNFYRIFGFKQPFLVNSNFIYNQVHPDDRDQLQQLYEKMYREHVLHETEYRILRADGKQRWVRQSGKLFIQGPGELVMIGVIQDLTVKKGLEKKVQELNEHLHLDRIARELSEEKGAMSTVIWLPTGQVQWSDGVYKLLGYKPGAVEPHDRLIQKSIYPDDLKAFKDALTMVLNGQEHNDVEFRLVSKAGLRQVRVSFRQFSLEKEFAVVGLLKDITDQVASQKEIGEKTRFAELMGDSINDMIIHTDENHTIINWNAAATDKTGIGKKEALYANFFDVFPALKEAGYLSQIRNVLGGAMEKSEHIKQGYLSKAHNYHLTPVRNEEDAVQGVLHVVQDMSRELDLQQRLNERLNFIENLVEASADRIVVLDRNMNYLYWNPKAEEYYAISRERIIGKNILEVFPGFRNDPSYQEFRKVLKGETVYLPAVLNESERDYFDTYLTPIKDEDGAVSAILWVAHDLSKDFLLQQQKHKAYEALSSIDAVFIELDGEYRIKYLNDAAIQYIGKSRDSLLGLVIWDVFPQAVGTPGYLAIKKAKAEQVRQTLEYYSSLFNKWVFQSVVPIPEGLLLFFYDRQDIKEAQVQLQDKESLLREAELVAHTGSYELNWQTGRLRFSEGMFRLFGEEPESFVPTLEFIDARSHPDDVPVVRQVLENAAADKKPFTYTQRIYWRDGEMRMIEANGKVIEDGEGNTIKFIGLVQDITERKKAEQELVRIKDELTQKATDKYHTLFNSIDEAFVLCEIITDAESKPVDYRVIELNPAFEKMTGISVDAAKGQTAKELVPALEGWWFETYGKVALGRQSLRFENYVAELDRWYNFYASPYGDEGSRQFTVVFADITERKRAEERQSFLLKLSDTLRTLKDPVEVQNVVTRETLTYFQADRCYYCEIEGDNSIIRQDSYRSNLPSISGTYPLNRFPLFKAVLDAGQPFIVQDVRESDLVDETLRQICIKLGVISFIDVPIIKAGKPLGILCLVQSEPRNWKNHEVDIIVETAERTWVAVERSKTEEALKKFTTSLEALVIERTGELKKRTEDLQKSLAILQNAEDLFQMGSWEYDVDSGAFNWSAGMYTLFGLPPGQKVVLKIYQEFAHEDDKALAKRMIKNLEKNHRGFEETLRIRNGDEIRTLKIKASAVCNKNGVVKKIVGVDRDITGVIKAEEYVQESRHWLQQTALASPDALTIYNLKKKEPVYLNNCLANWLGTNSDELVDMGIEGRLRMVHPDDRLKLLHFNERIASARDGDILTLEYRIKTKEDGILWIRNRSKILQRNASGEVTHSLSILQDITAEKASERVLQELNTSLEEKNKILENKNDEITSFAFIASHDLKEPLRKMHTFSDWLLDKERERLSDKGRVYLERMAASVKRMDLLIEDVLVLAKINSDKARVETIDVRAVIENVISDLARPDAIINCPKDFPALKGNKNQIYYLFHNLLENALKFQDPCTIPKIDIQSKTIKGNKVLQNGANPDKIYLQVSIKDNGFGFEEQYATTIFQVFQRLHQEQEFVGTGIGLAICRKIMENHHGFITAESKKGEGSTFYCFFPIVS